MTHTIAVIGAGRGLGRGAAEAFAQGGARVIAVARTESDLLELQGSRPGVVPVVADATEPGVARRVVEAHHPDVLVLAAGAIPAAAPFDEQSWSEFSRAWDTDVRLTHQWLGAALQAPLGPGARVVVVSSGAALAGSPLSGGYAGAKATQRFLVSYAAEESRRRGLGITFTAVLPRITPLTSLGLVASRAYAQREGITLDEYVGRFGAPLTPQAFGAAIRSLAQTEAAEAEGSFLVTSDGLRRLPDLGAG